MTFNFESYFHCVKSSRICASNKFQSVEEDVTIFQSTGLELLSSEKMISSLLIRPITYRKRTFLLNKTFLSLGEFFLSRTSRYESNKKNPSVCSAKALTWRPRKFVLKQMLKSKCHEKYQNTNGY